MYQHNSCIPITIGGNDLINHLTFDGCAYFCTVKRKCEIGKLDKCFNFEHRYCTRREYDSICYDYNEHCFWASSKECYNKIFKLDCSMNEIDAIDICSQNTHGVITGLSYNCCKNTLIVSLTCAVVEVDKCGKSETLYETECDWIMGILSLCPYIFITVLREQQYYVEALSQCGKIQQRYQIDSKFTVKNLIFNPCINKFNCCQIEALVLKNHCYPQICNWDIPLSDLAHPICYCNYQICEECCSECPNPHPHPKPDACADIMESIALIEAALSHILNAEGEKLQKVIAETNDIDKILCVNREVNKTIVNVTHLEHVLHAKLSALTDCGLCKDICNDKCESDCDCECGCDCYCCCEDEDNICTCDADGEVF